MASVIASAFLSRITLRRDKVESFERYPFNLPSLRALEHIDLHPKVTFFVGENGSGKSTLLEAVAVALGFNAEGGSANFRFATRESHSELHAFLRIAKGAKPRCRRSANSPCSRACTISSPTARSSSSPRTRRS